MSNKITFVLI